MSLPCLTPTRWSTVVDARVPSTSIRVVYSDHRYEHLWGECLRSTLSLSATAGFIDLTISSGGREVATVFCSATLDESRLGPTSRSSPSSKAEICFRLFFGGPSANLLSTLWGFFSSSVLPAFVDLLGGYCLSSWEWGVPRKTMQSGKYSGEKPFIRTSLKSECHCFQPQQSHNCCNSYLGVLAYENCARLSSPTDINPRFVFSGMFVTSVDVATAKEGVSRFPRVTQDTLEDRHVSLACRIHIIASLGEDELEVWFRPSLDVRCLQALQSSPNAPRKFRTNYNINPSPNFRPRLCRNALQSKARLLYLRRKYWCHLLLSLGGKQSYFLANSTRVPSTRVSTNAGKCNDRFLLPVNFTLSSLGGQSQAVWRWRFFRLRRVGHSKAYRLPPRLRSKEAGKCLCTNSKTGTTTASLTLLSRPLSGQRPHGWKTRRWWICSCTTKIIGCQSLRIHLTNLPVSS